ncbi:MAG TPA: hypothetical protein VGE62_00750 [Candidatus Paceibacterota bacterium]
MTEKPGFGGLEKAFENDVPQEAEGVRVSHAVHEKTGPTKREQGSGNKPRRRARASESVEVTTNTVLADHFSKISDLIDLGDKASAEKQLSILKRKVHDGYIVEDKSKEEKAKPFIKPRKIEGEQLAALKENLKGFEEEISAMETPQPPKPDMQDDHFTDAEIIMPDSEAWRKKARSLLSEGGEIIDAEITTDKEASSAPGTEPVPAGKRQNEAKEEKARLKARRARREADYLNDDFDWGNVPSDEEQRRRSAATPASPIKTTAKPIASEEAEIPATDAQAKPEKLKADGGQGQEAGAPVQEVPELRTADQAEQKRRDEREKKDEAERLAIFNTSYSRGAEGFADFDEAFDDKGFKAFMDAYERQNGTTGTYEEALENGNEAYLSESHEIYSKARHVAIELAGMHASELGNLTGSTLSLPAEAKQEIDAYVSRLLFETGNKKHIDELYFSIQAFKEGPAKVAEAEEELQEELKRFDAADIADLKERFLSEVRARDEHLRYADQLEEMLAGKKALEPAPEIYHRNIEVPSQGAIKRHYDKINDYLDPGQKYSINRMVRDLGIKENAAQDLVDELAQAGILERVDSDENLGSDAQYHPIRTVESKISRPGTEAAGLKPLAGREKTGEKAEATIKKEKDAKPLGMYGRYKQIGKLVEEGYITEAQMKGVGGFFGKIFRSTSIIKATAEGIRNRHSQEKWEAQKMLKDLEGMELWELKTKKDYQTLRKNLLVHLEPSKKIRDAFGKELANRIRQNLRNTVGAGDGSAEGTGKVETLERQQEVLDTVRKNQRTQRDKEAALNKRAGVRYGENEYSSGTNFESDYGQVLDESEIVALEQEVDESFRVTMAKKVAKLLEKETANMQTPFSKFAQEIESIFTNSKGETAIGSVSGQDARRMILQILRDKQEDLRKKSAGKSDFRLAAISRLLNKITKYDQAA